MRIPKKYKIGGHTIKVRYTKDIDDVAQADLIKNELLINKDAVPERVEASVFHEAAHFMNTSIEHALLDSLTEQQYQFLKQNKICLNPSHKTPAS
jgi:hypothetical protein